MNLRKAIGIKTAKLMGVSYLEVPRMSKRVAECLRQNTDKIMAQWEVRAYKEVVAAKGLPFSPVEMQTLVPSD